MSVEFWRPCVAKLNVHCINVRSIKNKAIINFRPCDFAGQHFGSGGDVAWQRHRRSRDKYISSLWITVHSVPRPRCCCTSPGDNYTNFEHSVYCITIRNVTFRLCVVYRPPPSKRNGFSNIVFFYQWSAF